MTDVAMTARARLAAWKADPALMVRELFGITPDGWQLEALAAFANPSIPRLALQACAGPGKSAVEAWIGWNFMLCYSDGQNHPNGACVSITGDNLKNGLWKELALWRDRSPVLQRAFEMTSESIFAREYPKTWFLNFRSFAKSADASAQGRTLSGLHARSILYLLDESGDMPTAVLQSAEQGLSNCAWGKIVQAGNPTSHTGALYHSVTQQRHLWHVIRITGDPEDVNRSPRISLEWAQQQIALYGRENPWVMAYILGKFPPGSINALLGADEVNAALTRGLKDHNDYIHVQKRLGIDCARFGDDRTVLFPRQGLQAFLPIVLRNARSHDIAGRVVKEMQEQSIEAGFIDDTGGWGAGTTDACRLGGIYLTPVNNSSKAHDPRYFNRRSEIHFKAAEWVKRGGCLPQGLTEIVAEATAPTYWFENGKLRVEEKAQIKARIGRSPDLWDAFTLTHALEDTPARLGELVGIGGEGAGMLSDYTPAW